MIPRDRDVSKKPDGDDLITEIRTKPCWICGQHSYISLPWEAWKLFDLHDIPLDIAWPEGPDAVKRLIISGTHATCWAAEYPELIQEEK